MSLERSDKVYDSWLQASQKFDYFVAGVCLALVGYLANAFDPAPVGMNASTLELAGVLSILLAAFAAFRRIEAHIRMLRLMHQRLFRQEAAGALTSAAASGGTLINKSTGDIFSAEEALKLARNHSEIANIADEFIDKRKGAVEFWYAARNWLLMLGLLALVAAKVLGAYGL